ncbi:MAG: cupin domain-containing protein [Gammaproteobacteria bacterium]
MLNMQFDQTVVIDTNQQEWEASPEPGVWRKPLAREAAEHGHTTSLVRFDPDSSFSEHPHPRGEEILVLDGVFSDERGDYEAGSYLRNPPGSRHSPFSRPGCVLLVKLDQFDPDDTESVRIDTNSTAWMPGESKLELMPLHDFNHESVALMKWPANTKFLPHRHFGGEEVYVLKGTLEDEYGHYPAGTWIRSPHNSEHCPYVEGEAMIWIKTGHLLP